MEFAVSIVGALATAVLTEAFSKAKAALRSRESVLRKVEGLESEFGYIKSAIEDHYKRDSKSISSVREQWIKEVRTLSYKIEDCIQKFLHRVMSDGGETRKTSKAFGEEIDELKTESDRIYSVYLRYETNTDEGTSASAPQRDYVQEWCELPVGMVEPLEELQKLVARAGSEEERKLKIISIVGFGGLGKTRLARQVYQHKDDKNKFHLRVMIRADNKEPLQLLNDILKEVPEDQVVTSEVSQAPRTSDSSWLPRWKATPKPTAHTARPSTGISINAAPQVQERNLGYAKIDDLVDCLKSRLEGKRYLIVIIDMELDRQWHGIKSAFRGSSSSDSRIIVTTTKPSIARSCKDKNGHVYEMSTLSQDDSRTLLFQSWETSYTPTEVEKKHIKAVIDKCDGLPLALLSTSHLLEPEGINLKKCEDAFSKICGAGDGHTISVTEGEEQANTSSTEEMRQVLLRTYQDLADPVVQACLLYLCMFPQDHGVRSNSLIRRWLAEGLTDNFQKLIDHGAIQSTQVSNNGHMKACKVPGILLEYITRHSMSQDFFMVWNEGNTAQPPADARRLSLHPNDQGWTLPRELPHIRTLAVFGKPSKGEAATALSIEQTISGYDKLRVLDLEECGALNNSVLEEISCNLSLLKYLSVGGSINGVSTTIRRLKLLETLDLRKTNVTEVPVQVIKLPQLKNLLGKFQLAEGGVFRKRDHFFENKTVNKKLVKFLLSDSSKLEMLSGFVTGSSQGFPQLLIHMIQLRKVKICCNSTASERNMDDLSKGIHRFLGRAMEENGYSLSIDIKDCPQDLSANFLRSLRGTGHSRQKNQAFLYSFKLHGNLSFVIPDTTTRIGVFPDFLSELKSITELCLEGTNLTPEELQAGMNRLPNCTLKYLKLVENKLGPLNLSREKFTSLVRVCLVAEEISTEITIIAKAPPSNAAQPSNAAPQSNADLPSLVSLHVLYKNQDGLSGIDIGSFPKLMEVGLHSEVGGQAKGLWEIAAKSHPNLIKLVLIDPKNPTVLNLLRTC